jgi:hypothetical protein
VVIFRLPGEESKVWSSGQETPSSRNVRRRRHHCARAVCFGDTPYYYAVKVCVTTLWVYRLQTHPPESAVQGRLAPTWVVCICVSELPGEVCHDLPEDTIYAASSPTPNACLAALPGAYVTTRPHTMRPQRRYANIHCLILWRVIETYGAHCHRRRRRCREDCVFWV